jgi:peptidoglycan-N-acetylglucosamine deacetylase
LPCLRQELVPAAERCNGMTNQFCCLKRQTLNLATAFIFLAATIKVVFGAECPGNADALGTSRVLAISPQEFSHVGKMQYNQALPLNDHEVVLTFDDGPLPPFTDVILNILNSQCVRATHFLIGKTALIHPELVRRIYNAGQTVGTHSFDHPLAFRHLSMARVEAEVRDGIRAVDDAIGDPKAVAPFFRIPGLGRSDEIDSYLASQSLVTWSADVVADDWFRHITPAEIIERAIQRLDAKGRGILLLHEIHPATALALPVLLKELKERGYHIVHVVAPGELPNSVPDLPNAPSVSDRGWPRTLLANTHRRTNGIALGKIH